MGAKYSPRKNERRQPFRNSLGKSQVYGVSIPKSAQRDLIGVFVDPL